MKRRALLIGINKYLMLGELKYAQRDAERFAMVLQQRCGFEPGSITLMTCGGEGGLQANSSYIGYALDNLKEEVDLDLLIVGFWGHGFTSGPGRRYLCGVETIETDLVRTAVSLNIVQEKLSQIQARDTLLLLDCCQNRPPGRSATAEPISIGEESAIDLMARDIKTSRQESGNLREPRVAILSACSEGQKAYEWDKRKHGIFTAHLIDGLDSGLTSIAQLSNHVSDRVIRTARELHHQPQSPWLKLEGGDIDLGQKTQTVVPPSIVPPPPTIVVPTRGHRHQIDLGDGLSIDVTWVVGGSFRMGNRMRPQEIVDKWGGKLEWYTNADLVHEVILPGYWMGTFAITNAQFMRYVTETGNRPSPGAWGFDIEDGTYKEMEDLCWDRTPWPWRDDNPVVCVSWNDATGFCKWLRQKTGLDFGLPSESQFEFAARGGTDTVFFWGDDPAGGEEFLNGADEMGAPNGGAWHNPFPFKSGFKWVAPVGSFKPNPFGLYDILGNVLEHCEDTWHGSYENARADGSAWIDDGGSNRVNRGGSWSCGPGICRSACRGRNGPGFRGVLPSVH